ncbi:MAG TPA: hypothetical protein PKD53_23845, partial [Chloroflexaceae bacterium]|nr:hypothetical protein [Chloroflexaceae bacterium]
MNDYSSPLTQRVRRLLGASGYAQEAERPSSSASGAPGASGARAAPRAQRRPDSGALFESQIHRLSQVLRELHAIDR